jgi:hypothetical protein
MVLGAICFCATAFENSCGKILFVVFRFKCRKWSALGYEEFACLNFGIFM